MSSVNIRIEIQCPKCFQASLLDGNKVPEKPTRVTCRRCSEKFILDRKTQLNCKVRSGTMDQADKRKPLTFDPENMSWLVQNQMCNGMRYDLKGLATLIRTGLINKNTRIKPPGSSSTFPAGMLVQLRPYFDVPKKDAEVDLDATLETEESPSSNNPKAWYELDCGDFLEQKLMPFLKKDILASKKTG